MLHLLFYLLLQLGLLEGPSNPQLPTKARNQVSTPASDGTLPEQANPGAHLETDTNIGGSGWDDKN
jgi:hypothetical protein